MTKIIDNPFKDLLKLFIRFLNINDFCTILFPEIILFQLTANSFKSFLIKVSNRMELYANSRYEESFTSAFHMQIVSLSFFNLPIEFNTHNTSDQQSQFSQFQSIRAEKFACACKARRMTRSFQVVETRSPLLSLVHVWRKENPSHVSSSFVQH